MQFKSELKLTLPGVPRTKKTSNRAWDVGRKCPCCKRGTRTVVMPSEAWCDWRDLLVPKIKAFLGLSWRPIDVHVNCAALYYREKDLGDSAGFNTGLADLLEAAGVVRNDVLIRTWDGSRLLKDAARPRVEVTLARVEKGA